MINLYNVNTGKEQLEILSNLFALLKTFDIDPNKHIIMAENFNLFFNSKLDVVGGKPALKRKSLAKLIELKEAYDLCDIWRKRNTKENNSPLLRNILLVLFNADVITFFISNDLQGFASYTDILTPISTNHCPVLFSLSKEKGNIRGKGLWKLKI